MSYFVALQHDQYKYSKSRRILRVVNVRLRNVRERSRETEKSYTCNLIGDSVHGGLVVKKDMVPKIYKCKNIDVLGNVTILLLL